MNGRSCCFVQEWRRRHRWNSWVTTCCVISLCAASPSMLRNADPVLHYIEDIQLRASPFTELTDAARSTAAAAIDSSKLYQRQPRPLAAQWHEITDYNLTAHSSVFFRGLFPLRGDNIQYYLRTMSRIKTIHKVMKSIRNSWNLIESNGLFFVVWISNYLDGIVGAWIMGWYEFGESCLYIFILL